MRLFLLTSLTMLAFAGNSLLTRAALAEGSIDPGDFAAIRLFSGALILLVISSARKKPLPKIDQTIVKMSVALVVYMIGFSFAYLKLDAGIGALILFGFVQLTMMLGIVLAGGRLNIFQASGGLIAFFGLLILFLPSEWALPLGGSLAMALAGVGWGAYSLLGRQAGAPLAVTALNFTLAFPLVLIMAFFTPNLYHMTQNGIILAVISGAITSGLGYSLWYLILPKLNPSLAATAQLSVPIIAMVLGAIWLGESLGGRDILCAALVISGIALSIWGSQKRAASKA